MGKSHIKKQSKVRILRNYLGDGRRIRDIWLRKSVKRTRCSNPKHSTIATKIKWKANLENTLTSKEIKKTYILIKPYKNSE